MKCPYNKNIVCEGFKNKSEMINIECIEFCNNYPNNVGKKDSKIWKILIKILDFI